MRRIRAAVLILLSGALLPSPSHALTIVNGSFETGHPAGNYIRLNGGSTAITGWLTTDSGVEWDIPSAFGAGAAADGQWAVDLANYTYSAGGIQQTIATLPGQLCKVGFFLGTFAGSGRDGTCQIVVSVDGVTQTYNAANTRTTLVWTPQSITWTADDTSATLWFRCLQNANLHFAVIDGVADLTTTPSLRDTWGAIKSLYR